MAPKKVLLTIGNIQEKGGALRAVINLADELIKNHEVVILSYYKGYPTYEIDKKIKIKYLFKSQDIKMHKGIIKNIHNNIKRFLVNIKINIIFNDFNYIIESCDLLFPYFKNKNTKYIKIMHNEIGKFKKRYSLFDYIVVLNLVQLENMKKHFKNTIRIPNFVNIDDRKDFKNIKSKKIISIGRINKDDTKGFRDIINIFNDALNSTKDNRWELEIIGQSDSHDSISSLQKEIDLLGIRDRVKISPFNPNISQNYKEASILASGSRSESFGLTILEALNYNLVSIGFATPLTREAQCDCIICVHDKETFVKKLSILMSYKNLSFLTKDNQKIKNKFSKQKAMSLWQEIIK